MRCGRVLTSSGVIYFFMRLKMAIRFLNWSLWLIILLRCVGGDFQVTSELDSFENQFQRVVEPTSPGICYAWITRWQRSSFAFFLPWDGFLYESRSDYSLAEKLICILLPWDVFLYESEQRFVIKDSEEKMV